ncbi:MAG: hypothetical protein OEV71_16040 [Nitrospira sp.]|nr:hypothetical protein [Nitrospira sp.]MDH4344600.1 hypothetical protein [Nitrospira sp.]MDH5337756.1 hypothetical protein [Nitrospira sp.]
MNMFILTCGVVTVMLGDSWAVAKMGPTRLKRGEGCMSSIAVGVMGETGMAWDRRRSM